MAYCRNCGNKLEDGAKFCPKCGTPSGSDTKQATKIKQKKSSKKGGLIATIIVLAVIALGGAWYFLGKQQDKYSLEGLAKAAVQFDDLSDFHEGFAFFVKNNKVGVINKMGVIIVEPIYDSDKGLFDYYYKDGMAKVCKNGKYGFIDKDGKEVVPCFYEDAFLFQDELAAISKEGKWGFVDKKGNIAIPLQYNYASNFSEGLSAVQKNAKSGYINKKGETVIPFTFDYADSFSGEVAIVSKDDRYCIIDKEGKVVKDFKSGQLRDFSDGMAIYEKEENDEIRYGFVDVSGTLVIPLNYYGYRGMYGDFKNGFASVMKYDTNKFGVIDKSGKTVIPFEFDYVDDESESMFCVSRDGKCGYYDNSGKCIVQCQYESGSQFSEELAAVKQGEKWGFINKSGKVVIPSIYDDAHVFSEGLAVVQKDGIFGFVDKEGNSTFDLQDESVKSIIQAKIEEEKLRKEEEDRRAEEERKRIEEERRRGIEKVITLSFTRPREGWDDNLSCSGSYGAIITLKPQQFALTEYIQIPRGKVWIYDRHRVTEGSPDAFLWYYSRESGALKNQLGGYDSEYELKKGGLPTLRPGDGIRIGFRPWANAETKSIEVVFREKDEDLLY